MRVTVRVRGQWAAAVIFLGLAAQAGTRVSYVVAIGYNGAPLQEGTPLPELRFADDDAVRYDAFFARFADHHWLLTVVDAETQRRYPKVSASARPPTLGALRTLVEELARQMTADRARGDEPTLYLTYSGHGAQGPARRRRLLHPGRRSAHSEGAVRGNPLRPPPAGFIHLFVDACHAEAVVGTRGASPLERDASTARLAESELSAVVAASSLRRFPGVGVLMATASEQESHEWARLQSGIFTHELLSGLTGAADVNGDGIIEYSELQAFVVSANRDIRDPRALPRVVGTLCAGCDLISTNKDACFGDTDCLSGYVCHNGHCLQHSSVSCDPLGVACSETNAGCFPVGTGNSATCEFPGTVPTNSPCTTVLGEPPECVRGNICLNVLDFATGATTRKCVQLCNPDGGAPSCVSGVCYEGGGRLRRVHLSRRGRQPARSASTRGGTRSRTRRPPIILGSRMGK